jgi:cytochrome P450
VFQRNAATITDLTATAEQMMVARQALADYLTWLLEIKTREPGDDLFSELAAKRVATGELTAEQAAGMGVLQLVAGHETTSSMISLSTLALFRHPDQLRRVLADLDSVPTAVEELLRYLTVAHFGLRRAALADIRIGDVTVHAGEGLILCLQSANRDPRVFEAPDDLVLDSGTRRHLAFGFGLHVCIGQTLARLELQTALPALFRRFPELRVAVPWKQLRYNYQAMIYGPHQLPVT